MNPFTAGVLFKIALWAYAVGAAGSLLAVRKDRVANVLGFGSALAGGLCGGVAAVTALAGGGGSEPVGFELWGSLIPYVKLTVKLDALGAFFLLLVSFLAVALSL